MNRFVRVPRPPGWALFLGLAILDAGIFPLWRRDSAPIAISFVGLGLVEIVAVVVGVRANRPRPAAPWRWLSAAVLLYGSGDAVQFGWAILWHKSLPFPSVADALYIGAYLAFLVGLVSLARHRTTQGQGLGALIDAAILTLAAGELLFEYILSPLSSAPQTTELARLVATGYPLLDLALGALLAKMLVSGGSRPPAFWFLVGFLVSQLSGDCLYTVAQLHGSFYDGDPLMIGWLLSFGFLGAAALHPSMGLLARPVSDARPARLSSARLCLLAVVALLGPAIYLGPHESTGPTPLFIMTAAMILLCIGRTAVLNRELDQKSATLLRRERELHSTVEELYQSQGELVVQARHDALTGLPNRVLFAERLTDALQQGDGPVAVLLLDLDGFKMVNDSIGHLAGDALLVGVSGRLAGAVRPVDALARLGGDEFTILAEGLDETGAFRLADRVLHVLKDPFAIEGHTLFASASIGIALCDREGERDPLRDADSAMYEAKRRGGNRYELFDNDMHARAIERMALESDLRSVELGSAMTLHYQPLFELKDGRLTGFEALLRWRHPERGFISPAQFVPIAEQTGAIVAIGRWVLEEACRKGRTWAERHATPWLGMNVNVSARQLAEADFVDDVARVLASTGFSPELLTLEITETMVMNDDEEVGKQLRSLKQLGVRISIDDFGTGYTSLSHLQGFPIDELKIDKSFVDGLGGGGESSGVAMATIRLARSLHLEVVAEGIERAEQLEELRRSSCAKGQGYYLGRPLPGEAAEALLAGANEPVMPPAPATKVLVVDDDETVRTTMARVLSRAGFETLAAGDGKTALALARSARPDAVVLDVNLPDVDGMYVCDELRRAIPDGLTVVQISGSAVESNDRVRGLDGGADSYLTKPVPPGELVATLRAALRARAEVRP